MKVWSLTTGNYADEERTLYFTSEAIARKAMEATLAMKADEMAECGHQPGRLIKRTATSTTMEYVKSFPDEGNDKAWSFTTQVTLSIGSFVPVGPHTVPVVFEDL